LFSFRNGTMALRKKLTESIRTRFLVGTGAIHILDRFHIMSHISKAIDKVRAQEAKELKDKGYEPILTKTRWLLLKRPENLTAKQDNKSADLLQYNLRSIRSYHLKLVPGKKAVFQRHR